MKENSHHRLFAVDKFSLGQKVPAPLETIPHELICGFVSVDCWSLRQLQLTFSKQPLAQLFPISERHLTPTCAQCYKCFTTVTYGRKLFSQCYKTFIRPYITPAEPSSDVNTRVKLRHRQWHAA